MVKTEASYIERWFFCPYRLIKHFKTKNSLSKLQLRAPRAFQNKFPCVYAQRCKTSHVAQWVSRATCLHYTHRVHNPRVLAWFLVVFYNNCDIFQRFSSDANHRKFLMYMYETQLVIWTKVWTFICILKNDNKMVKTGRNVKSISIATEVFEIHKNLLADENVVLKFF